MAVSEGGGDALDPGLYNPPDPQVVDQQFAAVFDQPASYPVQSPDAIDRNFAAAVAPATATRPVNDVAPWSPPLATGPIPLPPRAVNDVAPFDSGRYSAPSALPPAYVPFDVPYGPLAAAYGHGGSQENAVGGFDIRNPAFDRLQPQDTPPSGRELGNAPPEFFYGPNGEIRGIRHPLGAPADQAQEAAGIAGGRAFGQNISRVTGAASDVFTVPWDTFLGLALTAGTPQQVQVDAALKQRLNAEHVDWNTPEGALRAAQIRTEIARQVWAEAQRQNPLVTGALGFANPAYLLGGGVARAAGLGRIPVVGRLLESTVANAGMPGFGEALSAAQAAGRELLSTTGGRIGAAIGAAAIGAEIASDENLRRELAGQAPMAALLVLGILKKDGSLDRTVLGDLMNRKAVREAVVAYEKSGTAEDAAAVAKAVHDAAPSRSKAVYTGEHPTTPPQPGAQRVGAVAEMAPAYMEKVNAGWRMVDDPQHGPYWVKPDGTPATPDERPQPVVAERGAEMIDTRTGEPVFLAEPLAPDAKVVIVRTKDGRLDRVQNPNEVLTPGTDVGAPREGAMAPERPPVAESPLAARVNAPGPLGTRIRAAKATPEERAIENAGGTSAATARTNARLGANVVPKPQPEIQMVAPKPRVGKNVVPAEPRTPPVTRKVTDAASVEQARAVAQAKADAARPVPPKMTKVIEKAKQPKYTSALRESIGKTLVVNPEMTADDVVRGAAKQLQEALRKGGSSNLDVRAQRVLADVLLAEEANRNHIIAVQEARKAGVAAEYGGPPRATTTPTTYHVIEPERPGGAFRIADDRGAELPLSSSTREGAQKIADQRNARAQEEAGKAPPEGAGAPPPERPPTAEGERMGPPGQLALPRPTKETLRIHNAKVRATAKMEAQRARQADLEILRNAKTRARQRAEAARAAGKVPIELGPGEPRPEPSAGSLVKYTATHPGELINFTRAMRATADVSVLARQALIPLISNALSFSAERRVISRDTIIAAFRGYGKEYATELWVKVQKDPMFQLAKDDGLAFGEIGGGGQIRSGKEEFFQSALAERIPVMGGIVQGAERSYSSALNVTRFFTYKEGVLARERVGRSMSPPERASFVRYINAATGRGYLGKAQSAAPLLNGLFFAPRFAVSRFETFAEPIRALREGHAELAAREATDLVKFVGAGIGMLALAKGAGFEVGMDPTSSDFGKIRMGDVRIDIWGGFVQPAVLISRLWQDQATSSTTGKTHVLSQSKFGEDDADDVELNFLLSKLGPTPQTIMALVRGKDTAKQPFGPRGGHNLVQSATDVFGNTLVPLAWSDIVTAIQSDVQTGISSKRGLPPGVLGGAAGVAALAGVGVQTYNQTKNAGKQPVPKTPFPGGTAAPTAPAPGKTAAPSTGTSWW